MSETPGTSVFLVDPRSDPVVIRVEGRANFQNSGSLRDFIAEMLGHGKTRFVLDCEACAGMDSTFLGVLAGAAISLRKASPEGSFVVLRPGARNLELMRNLGLHRLLTIDGGEAATGETRCDMLLGARRLSQAENARLVLEAHENLVSADEANRTRFEDVLSFLRRR
jgi:anti-anti-sigma factor